MKKFFAFGIISLFIVATVSMFAGCKKELNFVPKESGSRPDGVAITITNATETSDQLSYYVGYDENGIINSIKIPKSDDKVGAKLIGLALYQNACLLDQLADYRRATSFCPTETMGVQVDTFVYNIKNGSEYSFVQYQIPREQNWLLSAMGVKASGYRSYYNLSMDKLAEQKVGNAEIDSQNLPYSEWGDAEITYSDEVPLFHKSQPHEATVTDMIITEETISSATIVFDAEAGLFKLELVLDVNNSKTVEKVLPNLVEGANESAHYTSIVETIELWDNGYFKYFKSTDSWEATVVIPVSATLPYETKYSYVESDCQLTDYIEITELKELVNQK